MSTRKEEEKKSKEQSANNPS